jgi:hypothetical protein
MANLLYLAAVVVVSVVISTILVVRNRKPTSMEAGIDAFNRELRALAPDKRGGLAPPRGRAASEPRGSRIVPRVEEPDESSGATPG